MAASNVTVDDSSPLILYDPPNAWTHPSGSQATSYANSTYSSSNVAGATAKFSFNGTGFWLLGAKKADYGQYIVMLDGEVQKYANATASKDKFSQVLGKASGLANGPHTVVYMAAGGGCVDIDAIIFETTTGGQQTSGASNSTAPASSGSQSADSGSASAASTSTSSGSQSTNRVSAQPNAVSGPNDPNQGGPPPSQPNGQPNGQRPTAAQSNGNAQATGQQSSTQGASDGSQSSTSSVSGPSTTQTEPANSSQTVGTSEPAKGFPRGALIGIAIGAAIGLLLIVALVVFLFRRRRRLGTKLRRLTMGPASPTLPLQDPAKHGSNYFFGGYGSTTVSRNNSSVSRNNSVMRELYLATGQPYQGSGPGAAGRMSQISSGSGATVQSSASSYSNPESMPRSMSPAVLRDSVYSGRSGSSASSGSAGGGAYPKNPPSRPPRPPDLSLSPV